MPVKHLLAQETQSQPQVTQGAQATEARSGGSTVPSAPAPAAQSPGTGFYWYWVAAVIVAAALYVVFRQRRRRARRRSERP